MIKIIQPGILASVQDLGREGFRSLGVGVSGAMDRLALRIANTLVGNSENTAGIETTLGGFSCRFDIDCPFAVTGAVSNLFLDGKSITAWSLVIARAGQVLEVKSPSIGMRSYVAFAGGIDVPVIMGSRSTDLKGGFGGYQGRPLRQGDLLTVASPISSCKLLREFGVSVIDAGIVLEEEVTQVRMIPAAEWGDFPLAYQDQFLNTNWLVDPISNRVGYRLKGPSLTPSVQKELLSHGILPGTIQLPPSGQPVIQMADANTCGGYPKLGVVIEADLWKLGQVRLGKAVRFICVTPKQALQAMEAETALLSAIRGLAALAISGGNGQSQVGSALVDAGNVIVTAPARGLIRRHYPNQSSVAEMPKAGERVEKNQLLCYLNAGLLCLPIKSPVSGVIQDFILNENQEVNIGEAVMSLRIN